MEDPTSYSRRESQDSLSSSTSNDAARMRKSKMVIKKKHLKQKPPPFIMLSASQDPTMLPSPSQTIMHSNSGPSGPFLYPPTINNTGVGPMNNSFISFTENGSDSDFSANENQTIVEVLGNLNGGGSGNNNQTLNNTPSKKHRLEMPTNAQVMNNTSVNTSVLSNSRASVGGTPLIMASNRVIFDIDAAGKNQSVETKKYFHPFAEKPSPFEEWKQALSLAMETIFQFVTMDLVGSFFYYLWTGFLYILFTPIVIIALLMEQCRKLKVKCKRKTQRKASGDDMFERAKNH